MNARRAVGRPVGRPVDGDGARTRQRILDVALEQLSERGYGKTTFQSIAAAVGITSRAVYHYFPSKAALVTTLLEQWRDFTLARNEHVATENLPLDERLVLVLAESMAIYDERPELAAFATRVLGDAVRYPELSDGFRSSRNGLTSFYRKLVDEAVAEGEIAEQLDPRGLVDLISGLTYGMATVAATSRERHRAAVESLAALLRGELLTGPARR